MPSRPALPSIAALVALTASAVMPSPAFAQPNASVEPQADEIFRAASDALKQASSFSFMADVSRDVVLAYGQKVQLSNQRHICVLRPGNIRGYNEGDLDRVDYWLHDGQATVFDRNRNVYAQVDTPGTIDQALDTLALDHGLVLPLADMLVADPYESAMASVEAAGYAGLHKVRGIASHHLVFRQPGMDWQLWIDAGDTPLPVRMVITFTDQPHAPQWMADFHDWNLDPQLAESEFVFEAPEDATQLTFDVFIKNSTAVVADPSEASQ